MEKEVHQGIQATLLMRLVEQQLNTVTFTIDGFCFSSGKLPTALACLILKSLQNLWALQSFQTFTVI